MKHLKLFLLLFTFSLASQAQNEVGLLKLKSGIKYKITKKAVGLKPKIGDYALLHVTTTLGDSVVYSSYTKGNPIEATVISPYYNGDINEVIALLKKGETAVAYSPKDSVFRKDKKAPRLNTPYDFVKYDIEIVDIIPQAKVAKWIADKDDKKIIEYFNSKGITDAQKTASGLYYRIIQQGTGKKAQKGNEVSMNYTGKFLDGKKFDSNTDPAFGHLTPLSVNLGTGSVIKGWDEGIELLTEGSKAEFYIPSALGYGQNPRQGIPANSVLMFDVEFLKIMPSAEELKVIEESTIQKYLKDNNLTAQKTANGLYYIITQPGTGENAVVGQTVTANYTGMLTNGTKFDSNTDSSFNHVQPYSFELGKGAVIAGWEEGFKQLNKGAKAKFIIPSGMAYGKQAQPNIPANSVLVFDVELADLK